MSDLLADFFDPKKILMTRYIPKPQVNGRVVVDCEPNADDNSVWDDDEDDQKDYYKSYVKAEEKLYSQSSYGLAKKEVKPLEEVYGNELLPGSSFSVDNSTDITMNIFHNYNCMTNSRVDLTIFNYKEEILNLVKNNQVVIIEGPTGCGKSTQVPQFLLDDCYENKEQFCKIVVTQPRRIAATSIAKRVCDERNWNLGEFCGYQVGLDRKQNSETALTYVTTGVLLQKLIKSQNLMEFSHIIIDEVHERTQEMDFLLLLIRKFLFTNSPNVKVLIMSATFKTELFAKYFSIKRDSIIFKAPIISVKREFGYVVRFFYLEHLGINTDYDVFDINDPKVDKSLYETCASLMSTITEIDKASNKIGNVLVFLPGIHEIEELYDILMKKSTEGNSTLKWKIIPLHSTITTSEQRKVFEPAPSNTRKIILSTNIAESSITIDVEYVIDFCLNKVLMVNPHTKYESLQMLWATHVNCTQRAGRVGRISKGRVYRLVPKRFYEDEMHESNTPEILRAPLERLVLATKLLNVTGPPHTILALAPDPPDIKNIKTTIWYLKECGGLLKTCKGSNISFDGDITFLGRVMSSLPISVTLSKFVVLGFIYGCLNECIIIAAGCSLHNVFSTPFQERLKGYKMKLTWADGSASDLIALLNLYRVWEKQKKYVHATPFMWAQHNCLNARSLRDWEILVDEITERLKFLGIEEKQSSVAHSQRDIALILKVIICGAFYPNYFVRSSAMGQVDEREAVRILKNRNPFTTVYLTNMDQAQPGDLYVQSIKRQFKNVSNNVVINFEKGSSKVYVTFANVTQPYSVNIDGKQLVSAVQSRIHPDIYKAVRMRQLKIPITLHLLPLDTALERFKQMTSDDASEVESISSCESEDYPVIPTMDIQYIELRVTEIVNVGHFWAHILTDNTNNQLKLLNNSLNSTQLENLREPVCCGRLYAAKYEEDNLYYRCTVLSLIPQKTPNRAEILFVDYGNKTIVPIHTLKKVPENIVKKPAQAVECMLSEIQPRSDVDQEEGWTKEALTEFKKKVGEGVIRYGKIYSVVDDIVRLVLYRSNPRISEKYTSLNDWLIKLGFAELAEESFRSKDDHNARMQLANSDSYSYEKKFTLQEESRQDIISPSMHECRQKINLRGPFSPLEMTVYPIKIHGQNSRVNIEGTSVNSVLLDSEPHDPHERLLVAAHVGQNASGSTLQARLTTVMPSILGFPPLMCLIFCPCMESKLTPDATRIAGILCGLGPEHELSKKSLYLPDDVYITLDVEITEEDFDKVNQIRYWMNTAMDTMQSVFLELKPNFTIDQCRQEIKKLLFSLLNDKRNSVKRVLVKDHHLWNNYPDDTNLYVIPNLSTNKNIWPLHTTVQLKEFETGEVNVHKIKDELAKLSSLGRKDIPFEVVTCPLCDQILFDPSDVLSHLVSSKHKSKVKELNIHV